jgi:16S rRNA (guanine527-N7)-methyltransferase
VVTDPTQHLVLAELARAGLPQDLKTADRLVCYVHLLVRWGKRINLTSRADPPVLVQRHLPDVLFLAPLLRASVVADIGAGAGFIGLLLPLLRPELELAVQLVEPNKRRCSFLLTAAQELNLKVQIIARRLEQTELPPLDLACSRATWPPKQWLTRARPLLSPQGEAAAFVASETALPAPPPDGLRKTRQVSYTLSDGTPRLLALFGRS